MARTRAKFLATAAALGWIAILNGCGGSEEDEGDISAPVVTLSSAKTEVQGGETVPLTASASDDVDGALDPTISCSGGELVGTLLVTSPVSGDTAIHCEATATDRSGNVGTAAIDIGVRATVASLTVPEGLETLKQGQAGLLLATNLPLTDASYAATIDGKISLTLARSTSETLSFLVPDDLSVGAHRLAVTVGDHSYSFAFQVQAAPDAATADPRAAVVAALTAARDAADAFLASPGSATADQIAAISTYRKTVADGLTTVDALSPADLRHLAIVLASNGLTNAKMGAAVFSTADCNRAYARSVLKLGLEAWVITVVGGVTAAAPPLAIAVVAIGTIIGSVSVAESMVADIRSHCLTETENNLLDGESFSSRNRVTAQGARVASVSALAADQRYGFVSGVTRSFVMEQTLSLDTSVSAKILQLKNVLLQIAAKLPILPDSAIAALNGMEAPEHRIIPSSEVGLAAISDSAITGSKGGSGNSITLTFSASEEATDNVNFDFTLSRVGADAVTFPAQLTVALPGADDAAITVRQGTPTQSSVQTRGADTLEVVDPPAHGSVTLDATGQFTYTPAGEYFGDDRFTYRARNKSGVSRTATVLISVERQFDGLWDIERRTTTTSETTTGLCPVEVQHAALPIAKVSDVLYTLSYQGYTLDLSMASKDDPAGLSGTITVTFPDDPGQTTETITVAIPDSTHLSGSSRFTYVQHGQDNEQSCTGTSTIVGTRP